MMKVLWVLRDKPVAPFVGAALPKNTTHHLLMIMMEFERLFSVVAFNAFVRIALADSYWLSGLSP